MWQSLLAAKHREAAQGWAQPSGLIISPFQEVFPHNWIIVRMGRSAPKVHVHLLLQLYPVAASPEGQEKCGTSPGTLCQGCHMELSCHGTLRHRHRKGCIQGGTMPAHI